MVVVLQLADREQAMRAEAIHLNAGVTVMKTYTKKTLRYVDRALRAGIGALIILSVLLLDNIAPWVAIIGAYPIFTAVYGYDLLYSGLAILVSMLRGHAEEKGNIISSPVVRPMI